MGTAAYDVGYTYDKGGNRTLKIDHQNGVRTEYHYDTDADPAYNSLNNRLMWYETIDTAASPDRTVSKTYYVYTYDETTLLLAERPRIVLHVIPFASFGAGVALDAGTLYEKRDKLVPFDDTGWDQRVNLDGVITQVRSPQETGRYRAYCQAFRNGIVETVDANMIGRND